MERIQERGLRFVYCDRFSSYSDLLSKSGKNMLYIDRLKKLALFVYKCVNQEGPSITHDLYCKKNTGYSLRDPHKLKQPKVNTTTFGLKSLRYSGSALWNKLPVDMKDAIDIHVFKRLIKTWEGPSCSCGFCLICRNKWYVLYSFRYLYIPYCLLAIHFIDNILLFLSFICKVILTY